MALYTWDKCAETVVDSGDLVVRCNLNSPTSLTTVIPMPSPESEAPSKRWRPTDQQAMVSFATRGCQLDGGCAEGTLARLSSKDEGI